MHVLPAGEQLPLGEGESVGGRATAAGAAVIRRGVTSPSIDFPGHKKCLRLSLSPSHTHNTCFAFYGGEHIHIMSAQKEKTS